MYVVIPIVKDIILYIRLIMTPTKLDLNVMSWANVVYVRGITDMIKCIYCGIILCLDHYDHHAKYEGKYHNGALVTDKDKDFNKPCLVCSMIGVKQT